MITRRLKWIRALGLVFWGVLLLAGVGAGAGLSFTSPVIITIAQTNDDNAVIAWPDCGVLQTTCDLTQPWVSVPSATSPYEVSISQNNQFFRLAPLMSADLNYLGTNDVDTNAACIVELDPVNLDFEIFATNSIFGETDIGMLDNETVDYEPGTNGAPGEYFLSGTYGDLTFSGVVSLCPDYTGYIDVIQEGAIKIVYQLGLAQVHIDGDGNQDGMTTDSAADRAGKDINPGCITFNNLDNHGETDGLGNLICDNSTSMIQGPGNQAEMAMVIAERIPIIPAGWSVTLTLHNVQNGEGAYGATAAVGNADVVQIFSPNPGPVGAARGYGTAILGGAGGNTTWTFPANDPSLVDLTTLKAGKITLYAEGLQRAFAASIKLSLELRDAANKLISSDELQLKVAPLIFLPNTINASDAYVSQVGNAAPLPNNSDFCTDFIGDLPAAPNAVTGHTIPGIVGAAGILNGSSDVWARDQFKIGYQQTPFQRAGMFVVLNSKRTGGLRAFPPTLLGPGFGYMAPIMTPGLGAASKDSFGNLEVSPPCMVGAANYPLGRIYYGDAGGGIAGADAMDPRLVDFLKRQGVQSPVDFNSDWLVVGHVDEFMSIVPDPTGTFGWKVFLANSIISKNIFAGKVAGVPKVPVNTFSIPQYASFTGAGGVPVTILQQLLNCPLQAGAPAVAAVPAAPAVPAVKAVPAMNVVWQWNYLSYPNTPRSILAALNTSIQNAFGLAAADIISVPVLFNRMNAAGQCEALTPDLVNGAVYQGVFIAPDAFLSDPATPAVIDPFQDYFDSVAPGALVPITYIDDWAFYHLLEGEVHCGSNEKRVLPTPPNWPLWWNP